MLWNRRRLRRSVIGSKSKMIKLQQAQKWCVLNEVIKKEQDEIRKEQEKVTLESEPESTDEDGQTDSV